MFVYDIVVLTFAVWMPPSDDSKLLRCTHLEMWSLNYIFVYVKCVCVIIVNVLDFAL